MQNTIKVALVNSTKCETWYEDR